MADEKDTKNVEVKGEAEVSGDVEAGVEFEGKATITQAAKEAAADPNEKSCLKCGSPWIDGKCYNPDCEVAQAQATKGAARDTAKAVAQGRPAAAPAAVSRSGRVD